MQELCGLRPFTRWMIVGWGKVDAIEIYQAVPNGLLKARARGRESREARGRCSARACGSAPRAWLGSREVQTTTVHCCEPIHCCLEGSSRGFAGMAWVGRSQLQRQAQLQPGPPHIAFATIRKPRHARLHVSSLAPLHTRPLADVQCCQLPRNIL